MARWWRGALVALAMAAPARGEPLGLAEALALAEGQHERAELAREAVAAAEADVDAAFAAVLPRLALQATGRLNDREVQVGDRTLQALVSANAALVLEARLFEGRALPLVDAAEGRVEAARLQSRFAIRELAFAVADAWYAAVIGTRLREAAERSINTAAENLEVVQARREVGKALVVDEARAELRVVQARESLTRAANVEASTRDLVGVLIGTEAPEAFAEPPAVAEPGADEAARERLDVEAQRVLARTAEALADAGWMAWLPSVLARGTASVTTEGGFGGQQTASALFLVVEWALYDAGRSTRDEQDAVRARQAALQASLQDREARYAVRQARRDLDTVHATGETAEQTLILARETRTQVLARYRAGRATALELVEAEDTLRQAELDRIARTLELYRARLALFRALGLDPLGKEVVDP